MKRILVTAFAVMALAVPLARVAFASEAELSDVTRPVDATAMQSTQVWQVSPVARTRPTVVTAPLPEPLRDER